MNKIFALLVLLIGLPGVSQGAEHNEAYYVQKDCALEHGIVEYRNADRTRVDCFTDNISMEYDFAYKWYECITQAMYYAMLNDNYAVCKLIVSTELDLKKVERAKAMVKYYGLPLIIEVVPG